MLHHPFVLATQIVALIVGVLSTLLENAPRPDSQIRAKALTRTIRTKERERLFRSSKGGLISPLFCRNSRRSTSDVGYILYPQQACSYII
jgi:hypothetical protein